jgi:hypothetical protein
LPECCVPGEMAPSGTTHKPLQSIVTGLSGTIRTDGWLGLCWRLVGRTWMVLPRGPICFSARGRVTTRPGKALHSGSSGAPEKRGAMRSWGNAALGTGLVGLLLKGGDQIGGGDTEGFGQAADHGE